MVKVIGCGAAGCSAAINAYESGVIEASDFLLLNTTDVDIKEEYHARTYLINKIANPNPTSSKDMYIERRGTGKERDIAKEICLSYFNNDNGSEFNLINTLSSLFANTNNIEEDIAVIVTSTEGGSGSGLSIHVAAFLRSMGLNIIIVPITGFEKDGRSLKNTFEFFKDMSDEYVIMPLSNKKFLDGGTNYPLAEKKANEEFSRRLRYIMGLHRRRSSCNKEIDQTDQFKAVTTPGIMDIIYVDLSEVKNIKMFNDTVSLALDETKNIDNNDPQQKKLAIYYNINDAKKSMIDFNATVVKERLGDVFELFEHIQDPIPTDPEEGKDYMVIISSGSNLPIEEIKGTYDRFINRAKSINKTVSGFSMMNQLTSSDSDIECFDMKANKKGVNTPSSINNISNEARSRFLAQNNIKTGDDIKTPSKDKFVDTQKKNEDKFKV